jgi:DNA-binding response OmpR family regulator
LLFCGVLAWRVSFGLRILSFVCWVYFFLLFSRFPSYSLHFFSTLSAFSQHFLSIFSAFSHHSFSYDFMPTASILLVEDDTNLGSVLQEYMALKDYRVELRRDGEAGWQAFQADTFDLCILDVMMPKQDGFTLAQSIRAANKHVPIVFVTAKSMAQDKIEGFRLGADDYITKPFSIEELMLRVQAILRRSQALAEASTEASSGAGSGANKVKQDIYTIGSYAFDYPNQSLVHTIESRQLTGKEAELLYLLCQNMNHILKRETALTTVWGDDTYFNGRSMDVYITKLRKYLKKDDTVEIQNIHGLGYKLTVKA